MTHADFIEIIWGNKDETYLLWSFYGDWTGEAYFNSMLQLWELMDTKEQPLNLHIDMLASGKNPSNLTSLIQAAIRKGDCNIKRIIVISDDPFWKSIHEITCRFSKVVAALDVTFVASVEEAPNFERQPEHS